ncbi:alpha-mannosidase [Longispora fulva]|uniref:Alpha-mannosidase n=1 Tax=Longispora fulva TaxID=619741 RepID=A0A8J7KMZ0_9ACTN|nr:NEW3 domain-containing protein [Longispora fulva]MBG6139686.1 alpha-mannosidase [Longispora fulva]GIG57932.1 alpha-mannosidase [Longispora fulva]
MQIIAAESTDLFVGTEEAPRQVLRVTVVRDATAATTLTVTGEATGSGEIPAGAGEAVVEIGLDVGSGPGPTGAASGLAGQGHPSHPRPTRHITITAGDARLDAEFAVEEPGYTVHLVSHFHYDPVWWNTQAAYTSPWEWLSGDASTRPRWERNSFRLVDTHIDLALRDPDYRFVLAEVDYLKPYFDVYPERKKDLRGLLEEGRVELMGGTYNEPSTNLTSAETTIRNIVYGIGYQRDILHGDPQTAWQLDVFGHDPQFPGYLADAGLTGSAWARGPFHQWGPIQKNFRAAKGDATVMQFPSEFEWISPSGLGVLTHYMPNHYSAGWWMDSSATLEEAEQAVYQLYRNLKPVAATKHILLPVGTDYTPPNRWVTAIHRGWAQKYVWPRFRCAIPRDFLDGVRAQIGRPAPQTRDMNPVYTGKDVSYIDTKQAQRAGEVAVTDAEKLATIASLHGLGRYPDAAIDKVWRQLAYGAHHDAITGSESDQVYIDLLAGWREAFDLATDVRDRALDALTGQIALDGDSVVVANTLGFDRSGLVRITTDKTIRGLRVVRDRGTLVFRAADVPAMGWTTYPLVDGPAGGWSPAGGHTIGNEALTVTADPARGGALSSILAGGRELLQAGEVGNELRLYAEYAQHPDFGEGPWHLVPTGEVVSSAASKGTVRRETSDLGERLISTGVVDGLAYEQTVTLWRGSDQLECSTRVLDHAGVDKLLRVKFPIDLPGALPISEVASAVVGRGYALPDVDVAEAPWTLDNPANTWFGLGSTARIALSDGTSRALGVAEVVVPTLDEAPGARDLVVALARVGVTATTSSADWSRYGWLDVDSNLPDFRIVLGGPDTNPLAAEILGDTDPGDHAHVWVPAAKPLTEVWQPNADLRDARALPALIVLRDSDALVADLADATITAHTLGANTEPLTDGTVALLTYGLPGFAVDPTGALHLSLMRSCTGWPSGVWIDPPRRTAPDGLSFSTQHWTHEFSYALVAGDGDWRASALPSRGQEHSTPLLPRVLGAQPGTFPGQHSFLRVEPQREVLLSALKPAGNPIAAGSGAHADPARGVTVRLAESTGFGRTALVQGLALEDLHVADLLERPCHVAGSLELAGSTVVTYVGTPVGAVSGGEPLGAVGETATPVFSRYWLHNRGPAPIGYAPVTVTVSPGILRTAGEPFDVEVVLANQLQDTAVDGVTVLRVPEGWSVSPERRVHRLPADGYTRFTATVTPAACPDGLYFVAAGTDGTEDVVTVAIGDLPGVLPTPAEVPVEDWTAAQGTKAATSRDTGLAVSAPSSHLVLRPGGTGTLAVTLTNTTRDEIHGEAQLVSPWGTWELFPAVVTGFGVAAGETRVVEFPVAVPRDFEPGHAWAMVKVMWFGRCQYAPTVKVEVLP